MSKFLPQVRKFIALVLAAQLIVSSGGLAWGQGAQGGDRGGGMRKGKPGQAVPMQKGGRQASGSREAGVETVSPALEKLPGGRALSRAVVPDQYVLGPGDGLTVNIWGEYEELTEVRVTPDGKIILPTIGNLKVVGLSLAQAESLVEAEVKKYYRNVKSGVSLTSLRVFEVAVLGAAQLPGSYLETPVKRVSDVLSEAGGVVEGGSSRFIQVWREGRVVAVADMTAFLRRGDQAANPYLMDGDVIFVPPIGNMIISVVANEVVVSAQSGQVIENSVPSTIEMKEGDRLADLLAELGSVSPWWNLGGIYILRESKAPEGTMKIVVDGYRLLFDKDESQNIEMRGGDRVFIPTNVRRVFVNGVVQKGGAFSYVPNRTAEEYLGLAGGVMLVASLDRSTIRRADGSVEPFHPNTILFSGDAIQVEQKYFATPSDYVGIIGGLTGLVFSAFAFLATLK